MRAGLWPGAAIVWRGDVDGYHRSQQARRMTYGVCNARRVRGQTAQRQGGHDRPLPYLSRPDARRDESRGRSMMAAGSVLLADAEFLGEGAIGFNVSAGDVLEQA